MGEWYRTKRQGDEADGEREGKRYRDTGVKETERDGEWGHGGRAATQETEQSEWGGGRVTQEKGTEVGDKGKMERRERGDKEEGGGRQKEGQDLKTEGRRTRVGGESRERRI